MINSELIETFETFEGIADIKYTPGEESKDVNCKIIVGTIGNNLKNDLMSSPENIRVYIFTETKESRCFEFSPFAQINNEHYQQSFSHEDSNFKFEQSIVSRNITQSILLKNCDKLNRFFSE